MQTQDYINREDRYGAHNYHPLPVVLAEGKGVYVWDVDQKRYYDFLSAYSAVNQGHCHPDIVAAMTTQAQKLTLTSRAFYGQSLGEYEEFMCKTFGYDKLLPMNSGAEAVETALKLCRKWAYNVKGVGNNEAKIIVCNNNFHGRTLAIVSMSTDPDMYGGFGPFTPGFVSIPYNNIEALATALQDEAVAGFLVEPIQGEAGINVPDAGYLKAAFDLCKQHNVLFMADEIQTGLCRTGRMLACDHDGVHPDVLILGKALSGGTYPISAVLASNDVMMVIAPGQHGSTFGGNALAAKIAMTAIRVLIDEKLAENAERMGQIFRNGLRDLKSEMIETIRGKGLLNATVVRPTNGKTAWDVCLALRDKGVLAKPTHSHIIRFAPPLVINEAQMLDALACIKAAFAEFD